MEDEMESVLLNNGTTEAKPLVLATFVALEGLLTTRPIDFYELVETCRDSNHKPWGNSGETLKKFSLLQTNGKPHDSIRNIVLSAVTGNDLEMTLRNPIKGPA
jgi:hypothetical protein